MQDLLVHKLDDFILPNESSTDTDRQISQSYLTQLLTLPGSIVTDPEVGGGLEVGKSNITDTKFMLLEANQKILPYLTQDYGVLSITLVSLVSENDSAFATINITKGDQTNVLIEVAI